MFVGLSCHLGRTRKRSWIKNILGTGINRLCANEPLERDASHANDREKGDHVPRPNAAAFRVRALSKGRGLAWAAWLKLPYLQACDSAIAHAPLSSVTLYFHPVNSPQVPAQADLDLNLQFVDIAQADKSTSIVNFHHLISLQSISVLVY